jgi:hypothetical protein
MHNYNLGDLVYHECDNAPFKVVGVRFNSIEIEGDFSGGTHNVVQRDWVNPEDVKPCELYLNHGYYKKNPMPKKFSENKPEWRIRDLATGKWVSKYSGGKSWYRKSECVSVLDKLLKSPYTGGNPGRYILEEYNIKIVSHITGILEVQERRNAEAEKRRIEEARLKFNKEKNKKLKQFDEFSIKEYGIPCNSLMLMLSRGIISESHLDDVVKLYSEYSEVKNSFFVDDVFTL